MTPPQLIDEADGLASLVLYEEAWEVLESLPASERVRPALLLVRLKVCTALEKWELGMELVRLIGPENEYAHRQPAGRFHLARACDLCGAGEVEGARAAVAALSTVWPEGRLLVLVEIRLAALW